MDREAMKIALKCLNRRVDKMHKRSYSKLEIVRMQDLWVKIYDDLDNSSPEKIALEKLRSYVRESLKLYKENKISDIS